MVEILLRHSGPILSLIIWSVFFQIQDGVGVESSGRFELTVPNL